MSSTFGRRSPQKDATSASDTQRGADKPARIAVRLDPKVAHTFRLVAATNGESMNTVLTNFVRDYIRENGFDPEGASVMQINQED